MDLTTPLRAGLPPRNAPLEDESGCLSVTGGARRERLAAGPPRRLAMARNARTTRSASDRANLYQQITERIIAQLEEGRVPWVQPWGTATASIGMPYNAVSDRRSEEHTSELQSLMRISYAVFCLKKTKQLNQNTNTIY